MCTSVDDCEANFDALYAQWEESEDSDDKAASEPKKGELGCANMTISGKDEESESEYSLAIRACTIVAACEGWKGEVEGATLEILNCDGASKLIAGLAAAAAVTFAM